MSYRVMPRVDNDEMRPGAGKAQDKSGSIRAGAAVLQAVRLFVDLMVNSDGWTMRLVCGIIYDDRMNEWVGGFK